MRCETEARYVEEKEEIRKPKDPRMIHKLCGKYSEFLSSSDKFLEEKRAAKEKW
nr:hypothetical protein [uncultured Dethiosulfovibrio sp.]